MPGLLVGRGGNFVNPNDFALDRRDVASGNLLQIGPNATSQLSNPERGVLTDAGNQGNWASDIGNIGSAALQGMGGGLLVGAGGYLGAEGLAALGAGAGGTEAAALGSGISAPAGAGAALGAGAPEAGYALGSGITPGAVTEAGGAMGSGIGTGAMGSLGLMGGTYPMLGASFADAGGVPGAGGAGNAAGGLQAPAGAQLGSGISTPAGVAPAGAGGGAAGPASTATTTGAGMSFTDSLMKQFKDNALGLGLTAAGTAASLSAGRPQIPNQQQLQGLGADAQGIAHQLIGQYQSGALNPNQQASLDQLTQNTKNQLRQYFASIGQGDSTAAAQAMAQVDQTALGLKQQMLDSALQQGLSAIGVAQGPLNSIAQYQLGQDAQLRQAFGNFAGGVGQMFGRNAGVPQPTKPVTSAGVQQPVSSVQSTPPQLG